MSLSLYENNQKGVELALQSWIRQKSSLMQLCDVLTRSIVVGLSIISRFDQSTSTAECFVSLYNTSVP